MADSGMRNTILLVDDDPAITRLYKIYLEYRGFRVFTADDALSAVQVVLHHHIDAIVTDMRMPGVDGQELLQCLREKRPRLPALIVSGYTAEFTLAIDDITKIFSKPVSLALLTNCLEGMLRQTNMSAREIKS
jgi:DNA-binding NtrC family response regulator